MYLTKERRSNGLHFNARAGLGTGGIDAIGFSVLSRYVDPRFNSFHHYYYRYQVSLLLPPPCEMVASTKRPFSLLQPKIHAPSTGY